MQEKKKKIRVAFDVDSDIYNEWIESMLEQKLTNKSEFFRQMVQWGVLEWKKKI